MIFHVCPVKSSYMYCAVKSTEMTRTGFEPSTTRPRTGTVQCGHDRSVAETRQLDLKTALFFSDKKSCLRRDSNPDLANCADVLPAEAAQLGRPNLPSLYKGEGISSLLPVHTHMYMYGSEWWVKRIRGRRANKQTCPHGQRWVVGIHSQ